MANPNFRNLKAGDKVRLADDGSAHIFLGFSDNDQQYGKGGPKFASWAQLAEAKGLRSFADLDALEEPNEYGYNCYACFQELEDCSQWHAYRFSGRWVLGSSANAVGLQSYSEES